MNCMHSFWAIYIYLYIGYATDCSVYDTTWFGPSPANLDAQIHKNGFHLMYRLL